MLTDKPNGWRRLSLLLGAILLLMASITSLSPEYTPPGRYNADKFIHAGFYCLLTLVWLSGVVDRGWAKCLAIAVAIFLYGALLELLQHYIDGRAASVADVGVNGLGIAMAILIKAALSARISKKRVTNKAG